MSKQIVLGGIKDHAALDKLLWSIAGHLIDTDLDLGNNNIVNIGEIITSGIIRSITNQYGPGILIHLFGEETPEHTNQTGSYDHTGGASERLFTKTIGDDFTADDAINENFIKLTGVNAGTYAEIKQFIDVNNVVVDGFGLDGDFAPQTFEIIKHPTFSSGAGPRHEFSVKDKGSFQISSYGYTGSGMVKLFNRIAADVTSCLRMDIEGNGFNDLEGIRLAYEPGDIQPGDRNDLIHLSLDETGSVNADGTTHVHMIEIEKTNSNPNLSTDAIHVNPGFEKALHVVGTPSEDPGYGYEVSSGSVVDRVNSGGGGNDAFIVAGTDVVLLDSVNDYFLIGSDNTFEIIDVSLVTGGAFDSQLEFYYSTAGSGFAAWTQFFPADSTNGFQNSGLIAFSAPGSWAKDDEAEIDGDITDAYYIGIKRTRLGSYTTPTESFFKTFADQTGGMIIRGDGVVQLPYLGAAPASLVNGMMWMENDGLHIYYNGAEKTVAGA